jgi:hypothetical protein
LGSEFYQRCQVGFIRGGGYSHAKV